MMRVATFAVLILLCVTCWVAHRRCDELEADNVAIRNELMTYAEDNGNLVHALAQILTAEDEPHRWRNIEHIGNATRGYYPLGVPLELRGLASRQSHHPDKSQWIGEVRHENEPWLGPYEGVVECEGGK